MLCHIGKLEGRKTEVSDISWSQLFLPTRKHYKQLFLTKNRQESLIQYVVPSGLLALVAKTQHWKANNRKIRKNRKTVGAVKIRSKKFKPIDSTSGFAASWFKFSSLVRTLYSLHHPSTENSKNHSTQT